MDIDYTEIRRAATRLARLRDHLVARTDVGEPDTGATPDPPGPGEAGRLRAVEEAAGRLASRLDRLAEALEGFAQEAHRVDDAHAHRLEVLAAAAEER